jgi:hypothetical protein
MKKPLTLTFTALVAVCGVGVVFAATAHIGSTEPPHSTPHSAVDYCPELADPLAHFTIDATRADVDDIRESMIEVRAVTGRAESEGVELHHPANQWILELHRSSDLFLYLLDNGQAEFTDDEFVDYVGRIAFWFERGAAVCGGQQA